MEAAGVSKFPASELPIEILLILAETSAIDSDNYDKSARWFEVSGIFRRDRLFKQRLVRFWAGQDVSRKKYPHFATGAALAGHVGVFGEILKAYREYYDEKDMARCISQKIPVRVATFDEVSVSDGASQFKGHESDQSILDPNNAKIQFPRFRAEEDGIAFLACHRNHPAANPTISPKFLLLDILCVLCRADRLPPIADEDNSAGESPAFSMIKMCLDATPATSFVSPVSRLTYRNLCSTMNPPRLLLDYLWDKHYSALASKTDPFTFLFATKLIVTTCLQPWLPMVCGEGPSAATTTSTCPPGISHWPKIIDWLLTSPGLRGVAPRSLFRRATAANNHAVLGYVLDNHCDKFDQEQLQEIKTRLFPTELDKFSRHEAAENPQALREKPALVSREPDVNDDPAPDSATQGGFLPFMSWLLSNIFAAVL